MCSECDCVIKFVVGECFDCILIFIEKLVVYVCFCCIVKKWVWNCECFILFVVCIIEFIDEKLNIYVKVVKECMILIYNCLGKIIYLF